MTIASSSSKPEHTRIKAARAARVLERCCYRFANDGRCRLLVPSARSHYCVRHSECSQKQDDAPDKTAIAAALTDNLQEFKSAAPINDFLARLLLLLAHDQISPRRAAVLAYITNQLLRTIAATDRENDREHDRENQTQGAPPAPRTIIFDMPHPPYEDFLYQKPSAEPESGS